MNIFITGGSGFVGTNFIENTPNFNHTIVDLQKNKLADIDFKEADCILHLAALVHQMQGAPKEKYFEINSDLAFETALKAKKTGVKHFIFLSTIKVYGESTNNSPVWTENSKCEPVDDYGKSKLDAEKRLLELADNNFIVTIVRPPLIYGKGVKGNMISLLKIVDKFQYLPFKNTNNKRSFVYIKNLSALISVIIDKKAPGIFLASDSSAISTQELIELIAQGLNKKINLFKINIFFRFLLKKIVPAKYDRLWGNLQIESINYKKINFKPPYSTAEGLKEMSDWYKSNL